MLVKDYIPPFIFIFPQATLIILTFMGLTPLRTKENFIKNLIAVSQTLTFFFCLFVFFRILFHSDYATTPITVVDWNIFSFGEHVVDFKLTIDRVSIYFVLMASILTNIVGVFSQNYLHRDPGFFRFFYLITIFFNGILILFMGSSYSVVFVGWELIGLASAMLISFFNSRRETIDNALHAFWSYRITDVGILTASALLSAEFHSYHFNLPVDKLVLEGSRAYAIPLLLLLSAMGKSAQYPFSSWLPKAMEGPTSSSAIFYGGLSIHAGVYILLRLLLEIEVPFIVKLLIFFVGITSAIYGTLVSQVQSDVKSALAFASLSQVGIMLVELSLGLYKLVILHCLGHAFLRTYQILKSASIVHEFMDYEDAHRSDTVKPSVSVLSLLFPAKFQNYLYSIGFNLTINDTFGPSRIVIAIEKLSRTLERLENRWLKNFL